MTDQTEPSGYRSETTRQRAGAMSPGPVTPLGMEEEARQREVAESVNPGPNTSNLGLDERAQHRSKHVNPGPHEDLPDDVYERDVASRMNIGPQE